MTVLICAVKDQNSFFYWIDKSILPTIFNWYTFISLIIFCVILVIILVFTFIFTNRTNRNTSQFLDEFRDNGKYIDGLYIELDDSKDLLRCFSLGKRLKRKIIHDHNRYIKNQRLCMIAKKEKYSFRIRHFCSKDKIIEKIDSNSKLLEMVSNSRDDFSIYAYTSMREYNDLMSVARKKLLLFRSGTAVLIGDAGNGKTTLLCNIAQMLINYKRPCTMINSRDVKSTLLDHFVKLLPFPEWIKNKHLSKAMRFLDFFLTLSRKNYVIIVDAINENDSDIFTNSISDFCDWLKKYNRIKVVFSCRSEFYKTRYESWFKDVTPQPIEVELANNYISERTKSNVLKVYRKYYNYSGNISEDSRQKLFKSMLLMRLFFEVNQGKNNDTIQLYNHSIYYNYIQRIDNKLTSVKLTEILDNISDIMIEERNFDSVDTSKLRVSITEVNKIIDNNLVLSKTAMENEGFINQTETTFISFTFDEIRDYYIARRLITVCEDKQDFSTMFDVCTYLYEKRLSPTEGVIKYCYFHLYEKSFYDIAKKLLKEYCSYDTEYRYRSPNNMFNRSYTDLGLSIVMECPRQKDFLNYERVYILASINCCPISLYELLFNLTYNEINEYTPDNTLLLESLMNPKTDIAKIKNYLSRFFDGYGYDIRQNSDEYREFTDYLIINKNSIDENSNMKKLIILLAALYDNGFFFLNYILQDDSYLRVLQNLIENCNNTMLSQELEKLTEKISRRKGSIHNELPSVLGFLFEDY